MDSLLDPNSPSELDNWRALLGNKLIFADTSNLITLYQSPIGANVDKTNGPRYVSKIIKLLLDINFLLTFLLRSQVEDAFSFVQ